MAVEAPDVREMHGNGTREEDNMLRSVIRRPFEEWSSTGSLADAASADESDGGFTLVELLVVVVIMGVLATVSVLGVRGLTDRGQQSACESDQRVVEVAVETWFADESLPTSGTLTEAALVEAQLLRAESTLFDVQANGTVVPVADGLCDQA